MNLDAPQAVRELAVHAEHVLLADAAALGRLVQDLVLGARQAVQRAHQVLVRQVQPLRQLAVLQLRICESTTSGIKLKATNCLISNLSALEWPEGRINCRACQGMPVHLPEGELHQLTRGTQ